MAPSRPSPMPSSRAGRCGRRSARRWRCCSAATWEGSSSPWAPGCWGRPPVGRSAEALLAEGPDTSLGTALIRQVYLRAATTAGGAGLAWLAARMLTTPGQVSTVALVALVGTQLGQTMAVQGRTPLVLGAGVGSLLALAAVVQTPGLSQLFGCRPLAPHSWAIALVCAALGTMGGLAAGRW